MRIKFQRVINPETLLFFVIVVMALLLQFSLRSYPSLDFLEFGRDWYWYLRKTGFEAFSKDFYNYTPLYLYLLFFISLIRPPVSAITAVKLPAIIADFFLAGYGSRNREITIPQRLVESIGILYITFCSNSGNQWCTLGTDRQLIYSRLDCLSILSPN